MSTVNVPTAPISDFARVLRGLLDETGVFSRDEWARVLVVSPAAISQWVNDHTIPRASLLRSILDVVKRHCGDRHPALLKFFDTARRPADAVSPHGTRMRPTVGHYLVTPVLEGFQRVLETIPPERQEQVLFRAAAECRRLRYLPSERPAETASLVSPPANGASDSAAIGHEEALEVPRIDRPAAPPFFDEWRNLVEAFQPESRELDNSDGRATVRPVRGHFEPPVLIEHPELDTEESAATDGDTAGTVRRRVAAFRTQCAELSAKEHGLLAAFLMDVGVRHGGPLQSSEIADLLGRTKSSVRVHKLLARKTFPCGGGPTSCGHDQPTCAHERGREILSALLKSVGLDNRSEVQHEPAAKHRGRRRTSSG
jgi:hypothetical protein